MNRDTEILRFEEYHTPEYLEMIDFLQECFEDKFSKDYYRFMKQTVIKGCACKDIEKLYCDEPQYFLNQFRGKLDGVNFVDAGAYDGDTVRSMLEAGIHPGRVYCFEADYENYIRLQKYVDSNGKNDVIRCENYAFWDSCTKVGMKNSNFNARVDVEQTENLVETITIDKYFANKKIDFLKMDIEGAEHRALLGGMKVILRDRPILAISIYHSMEDRVEIPRFLMKELKEYRFFVRHHSCTYAESVLYGIPLEMKTLL